jgi:hypothetical protein
MTQIHNSSTPSHLHLHLGETVLPHGDVGGDTVLAVVEKDNHAVGVHRLASEELVVLEVADNLLSEALGLALKVLDLGLVGTLCLKSLLDGLHVACDVSVLWLQSPWWRYTPLRYVR